jgi:hypothetical protein
MVGDVRNSPGRSLYVRLSGTADGLRSAGKWTDAASGDHGDLLDVIAASCGHTSFRDTLDEARLFLSLPAVMPGDRNPAPRKAPRGFVSIPIASIIHPRTTPPMSAGPGPP